MMSIFNNPFNDEKYQGGEPPSPKDQPSDRFGVKPEARFVVLHAYHSGWTTNLPAEMFLAEDSLLADTHDDKPISIEHGGPVRAIAPRLSAWKSAKWIRGIEFVSNDRAGYWENGGYHMLGDPWREQRFRGKG
jgi:DMSO/TMAO reductase YedYZ molybdopterin-dependent catalytic subunit